MNYSHEYPGYQRKFFSKIQEKNVALISGFINATEIEKKGIVFFILRVDHKSKR